MVPTSKCSNLCFGSFLKLWMITMWWSSTEAMHVDSIRNDINVSRMMFGSCCNEANPQPFWAHLASMKPDAWVWVGDAVYSKCNSLSCLRQSYDIMKMNKNYSEFTSNVPFVDGTWDDHDFGANDAGESLPFKTESQKQFLSFLNVSNAKRLKRNGVYSSHLLPINSPDGIKGYVKLILLDTRFSRSQPLLIHHLGGCSTVDLSRVAALLRLFTWMFRIPIRHQGDILGEEQWAWLEHQFQEQHIDGAPIVFNILVSSIQVLGAAPFFESWNLYPASKERLFRIINELKPPNLYFISGDVHLGQLLGHSTCVPEVTTSGMTHTILKHKILGALVHRYVLPRFQYPFTPPTQNTTQLDMKKQMLVQNNYALLHLNLTQDGLHVTTSISSLTTNDSLTFHRFVSFPAPQPNYTCLNTFLATHNHSSNFLWLVQISTLTLCVLALSFIGWYFVHRWNRKTTRNDLKSCQGTAPYSQTLRSMKLCKRD